MSCIGELGSVVLSILSKVTNKKTTRNAKAITDLLTKIKHFPCLHDIRRILENEVQKLPETPSIKVFESWLHLLKESLRQKYELRSTLTENTEAAAEVLRICDGVEENSSHIHRANTMWCILTNLGFNSEGTKTSLKSILPMNGEIRADNSDWTIIQSTWNIRLFYYQCSGQMTNDSRCDVVRDLFRKWEISAGSEDFSVPPQLAFLKADCLKTLLPPSWIVFLEDDAAFRRNLDNWKREQTPYVLARLRQFPFRAIEESIQCTGVYTHNPYSTTDTIRWEKQSSSPHVPQQPSLPSGHYLS